MATLKKYQLNGEQSGEIAIDDAFVNVNANSQMIKDYIVALRTNARQWSANTKGRSEVNHSTQKPHRQKGLGRSRQGSLAAPQYRGGGRVFGPKPKFDQHVRINRKERRLAIRQLLAEKMKAENFIVIEGTDGLNAPKTKSMAGFLKALNLSNKRVLFLGESCLEVFKTELREEKITVYSDKYHNLQLSLRNIPRVAFSLAPNASGYDVALANTIVATEGALAQLQEWLGERTQQ
ncbi:MAG: 50S ribosomal protein L4 [Parachlamydiales bacterium]|nr:50S ribosomal protein L4 [Parachlamydiales bacterium]